MTAKNNGVLDVILAFLFARWHLRDMPRDTPEARRKRAVWLRDHSATFAGRWFIIGLVAMMLQFSPLGFLFSPGGLPLLVLLFGVAFVLGVVHLAQQIIAQKTAGPPPIDPPVEHDRDDN